jgi:hypothetical protein
MARSTSNSSLTALMEAATAADNNGGGQSGGSAARGGGAGAGGGGGAAPAWDPLQTSSAHAFLLSSAEAAARKPAFSDLPQNAGRVQVSHAGTPNTVRGTTLECTGTVPTAIHQARVDGRCSATHLGQVLRRSVRDFTRGDRPKRAQCPGGLCAVMWFRRFRQGEKGRTGTNVRAQLRFRCQNTSGVMPLAVDAVLQVLSVDDEPVNQQVGRANAALLGWVGGKPAALRSPFLRVESSVCYR